MGVDVQAQVLIPRRREEVATFMFDPHNDAIWTSGVVESRPRNEGPLTTGARVERISKFLGRQFGYEYEVIATDGTSFVEMRVEQPFPMHIRYELEEAPGGTVARIRTSGDATGFFRMAAPLLGRMVRRSITNDLETLKVYLEGRAEA